MFILRIVFVLIFSVQKSLNSLNCPSISPPNATNLRRYRLQVNFFSDIPVYSLAPTGARSHETFRFANSSADATCGGGCLLRLFTFANEENFFLTSTDFSPGFGYRNRTNDFPLFCVRVQGDCNAWVPFWRHFYFEDDGIHYAYSTANSVAWATFREPLPVCFVWSPNARARSPICAFGRPANNSLAHLRVFDNRFAGSYRDHLYTTLRPPPEYRHELNVTTGFVVIDDNATDCDCLRPLIQVYAYNEYLQPRRDHRFVYPDRIDVSLEFGRYRPTGESIFCASEYGACGATLPMKQYFDYVSLDTTYTFADGAKSNVLDVPSVPHTLCYIWGQ